MRLTAPDCADHGPLILDYVRGNLDEAHGLRAEVVLADCPDCRAWMNSEFSGPAFAVIDDAVNLGLKTATLPDRRGRLGWLAAAAAILVIAGGLTVLQLPHRSTPMMPDRQDQTHSTRIVSFDFESGAVSNAAVTTEETSAAAEADPLFSDDLEDGGAGSWTFHT